MPPGHEPRSTPADSRPSGSALSPRFETSVQSPLFASKLRKRIPECLRLLQRKDNFFLFTEKIPVLPPPGDATHFAREPTTSIPSDYSSLKRDPEVTNLSGVPWGFKESNTPLFSVRASTTSLDAGARATARAIRTSSDRMRG